MARNLLCHTKAMAPMTLLTKPYDISLCRCRNPGLSLHPQAASLTELP